VSASRTAPSAGIARIAVSDAVLVAGITIVALAIRLTSFDESFFGDELFTYEIATRPDLHAVLAGVRSNLEITPPLYFVIAWLFQKLGDPFVWLRIPSLLAGLATIPLTYVLGVRTVGRRAALVAAGLFALSPIAIYYATEARAYALMTMLVVLSTIALLRAIETNDRRWWAALAVLDAAAMYSHYTSVFVLAAQAAWALWAHRELWRPLILAHAGAALLFAPWLPFMAEDSDAPNQKIIEFLDPFKLDSAIRHLGRLADGGPYAPLSDLPGTPALVMLGLAAAIGLAGLVRRARRSGVRSVPDRVVLIALLALANPVGAAAYSAVTDDLFVVRNLIASLPALCLAFAALLMTVPRPARAVALLLAFAALGLGAVSTIERDTKRPAYEEAASFIESRARPGDAVLELQAFPDPPGRALGVHIDEEIPHFPTNRPGAEQAALRAAEGGRIFLARPEVLFFAGHLPDTLRGYRPVETRTWPGQVPLSVVVLEPR
jgi:dolichyl-phosphate-mannose-protein mannosyltransferase